jgi:phosphohistidine phosphatase
VVPEIVLTSTAERASDTAERVFGESGAEIVRVPDLYMASAHELLETAEAHGSGASCVALVAHDPGMHSLASRLVRGDSSQAAERIRDKYPTCALAEFDVPRAEDGTLNPDGADLVRFIRPKDLPDATERRL